MPLPNKKYDTLFLDRDGVLNRKIENGYVLKVNDIVIPDGVIEFLNHASLFFNRIVVVTNQRCVGRKLLSLENLAIINDQINKLTGSQIKEFFVCPHLDEDNCECRKPKNGLFLRASSKYNIDFKGSWLVGDSESDLIPAKGLMISTLFISSVESPYADKTVSSMLDLDHFFEC